MFYRGAPELGMLLYLVMLQAIIILKGIGYAEVPPHHQAHSERLPFTIVITSPARPLMGCYYFWGLRQG